jgi:hypothetical protein
MVEISRDALARAHTALVPFVAAYGLPLNPEDLDELAFAVISHLNTDESLQDIYDSVQRQIGEATSSNEAKLSPAKRPTIWIFHGEGAPFASAVFQHTAEALSWANKHHLTGTLTEYPVGDGCYDIAVANGHFTPHKPHHGSPDHVARFSPSRTEHIHLRDGQPD